MEDLTETERRTIIRMIESKKERIKKLKYKKWISRQNRLAKIKVFDSIINKLKR